MTGSAKNRSYEIRRSIARHLGVKVSASWPIYRIADAVAASV